MAESYSFLDPSEDANYTAWQAYRARQQSFADTSSNSDLAQRVAEMAAHYPKMQPGVALALTRAGITPGSAMAEQSNVASGEAAAQKAKKKGWFHDMFNATVRGGMVGLSYPYQELSGAARTFHKGFEKHGVIGGLAAPFTDPEISVDAVNAQTHLGQIADAGIEGRDIDTGSGFFVNESSDIARRAGMAQREAWTVDGHAATLGRVVAGNVTDPDTVAYNALSGTLDFASALALDPTNVFGGEVAKARVAGKLFTPGDAGLLASMKLSPEVGGKFLTVGGIKTREDLALLTGQVDGDYKAVVGDVASQWLESRPGRAVSERIAEMTSPTDIRRAMNNKIDIDIANELADANDPTAIQAILKREIVDGRIREKPYTNGMNSWKPVQNLSYRVKRNLESVRLFQAMPGQAVQLNNPTQTVDELDRLLKNANYKVDQAREWTDQMARATSSEQRRTIYFNALSDIGAKLQRGHIDEQGNAVGGLTKPKPGARVRDLNGEEYGTVVGVNKQLGTVQVKYRDGSQASLSGDSVVHQNDELAGQAINELTRVYHKTAEGFNAYNIDDTGREVGIEGLTINNDGVTIPQPLTFSQLSHEMLPALTRDQLVNMRRETSRFAIPREVLTNDKYKAATYYGRYIQNGWRNMALIRAAYTLRVVGEEQLRMAANGLNSLLSFNPLSAIATVVGVKGDKPIGRMSGDVWGRNFAQQSEENVLDEFSQAHMKLHNDKRWAMNTMFDGRIPVSKGHEKYATGWSNELGQLHADALAARLAGGWREGDDRLVTGNDVQDAKEWFWSGKGKEFRLAHAERGGNWSQIAEDRELSDRYVDAINDMVRHKTADDPELRDLVAFGTVGPAEKAKPLQVGDTVRPNDRNNVGTIRSVNDDGSFDIEFVNQAERTRAVKRMTSDMLNSGTRGRAADRKSVEEMLGAKAAQGKGPEMVRAGIKDVQPERRFAAVDHAFDLLISKPSNYLSRSSTFRQYYWERANELFPMLDRYAQAEVLKNAREDSRVTKDVLDKLYESQKKGSGDMNLDSLDLLSKGHALDATKTLLYDLSERSQFFDQLKIVFPFGEAWKEAMTTYAKAFTRSPHNMYRLGTAVEGGQQSGFFYTDENGQVVFNYPLSAQVSQFLTGTYTPLKGQVSGLNLAGNGLPGVGPVVQMSLGKIVNDKPQVADWVNNWILPTGDPDYSGGFIEAWFPGWTKRLMTAAHGDTDNRQYGNAVGAIMRYKSQTGQYDLSTEDGMAKLEKDSKAAARRLYVFRGLAQFIAPTAPSPEWMAKDDKGNLTTAAVLMQDYRAMQNDPNIGYKNADEAFLNKYGDNSLLYMQSFSQGGFSPTDEMHKWVQDNSDIANSYRDIYGYFAPDGGVYSGNEYERQLANGECSKLTSRQILEMANNRVATMQYMQAKQLVGDKPNENGKAFLRNLQESLIQKYPGYSPGATRTKNTGYLIDEVQRALTNEPKLRESDVGQAAISYMKLRAMAAEAMPGYATSDKGKRVREGLRTYGDLLVQKDPEFERMWELFDRELKDDSTGG